MNKEERENREFEKLKELGLKLHVPIPETFLTLEVFDKDGNPVCPKCSSPVPKDKESCPNCDSEIIYHQRSHSWVRNAYNRLFIQIACKNADDSTFAAGKLSHKDTGGTVDYAEYPICLNYATNHDASSATYGILGSAGNDDIGILVGSGTNAESFEDYALQTKIADGTSSGEISYVKSQTHSITYTAGTKVLKDDLVRYFNNNTGGNTSINEVCLVVGCGIGADWRKVLQARDVLGATVTVAATGQMKAIYTIQLTYPS